MLKKILLVLFVVAVVVVGVSSYYYNKNFAGAKYAFLPAAVLTTQTPKSSNNSTGLPLAIKDGFSISTFAEGLGNPRVLAFDDTGRILVSIPSQGKIVSLVDADHNGASDETRQVLSGLNSPHGIALYNKKLYVGETDKVSVFDYNSETGVAVNKKVLFSLPSGGLHFSRTVGVGPDKKLYVSIGSSCNVCIEKDERRAAILQSDLDGKNVHVFARGLRNTVFFIWDKNGDMWGNDMGRDNLGDDVPPDEINKIENGKDYGWPYCYGKNIHDNEFDNKKGDVTTDNVCEALGKVGSVIDHPAHSAPLGLAVVPSRWPQEYQGNLLVAYHGSWNRTSPTGYKIVRIKRNAKGERVGMDDFISGWLSSSSTFGRPVDVVFSKEGSLFITDDKAGKVYKVTTLD